MKKLTVLFFLIFSVSLFAQSSVAGYVGFGYSAFDFKDFTIAPEDQAGYIPIGAQITLGEGMIQFGAEASFSAVPFTFEYQSYGNKVGEVQITQLFAGGFVRLNLGNEALQPYVKAGGGAYIGKMKWEPEPNYSNQMPADEIDFKTAFGFYGAVGIDLKVGKTLAVFAEAPIHIVQRKPDIEGVDEEDIESFTANNWAILAGVRIFFK